MKKINIYILSLVVLLFSTSCEEDLLIFDNVNGQTLVTFDVTNTNLPIVIDDVGSVDVTVNVTTVSSVDRTYTLTVDTDNSTAAAETYSVPSSVTIAAGDYNGTFTITGTDINVETDPETLLINLSPEDGSAITEGTLTVSVFQICPVTAAFTGTYEIEVLSAGVFGAGTFGGTGETVEISVGSAELERTFSAAYFQDARFVRDFTFTLVCNEVIVPYTDMLVGCGGNDVNLSIGPATTPGTYDPDDDSSFIINLTDNVDSDCGGGPVQASYRLTKVE